MRTPRLLILLVLALSAGACVSNRAWRTVDPTLPRRTSFFTDCASGVEIPHVDVDSPPTASQLKSLACTAEESHAPAVENGKMVSEGYDLHEVEFDDQGALWNRDRYERSMKAIEKRRAERPVLVVMFVHGWKHNARTTDSNLVSFRGMLDVLARSEVKLRRPGTEPRRVIGVYLGWRGATSRIFGLKELTFWGRKSVAHTIGQNGAPTELVKRLDLIVHNPVDPPGERSSAVVYIGHSFGAALLFSSVGNMLNASAAAAFAAYTPDPFGGVPGHNPAAVSPIPGVGDLVVLINPAFEGSRYQNLHEASHLPSYDDRQLPTFVTLASEGDSANRLFFPLGQTLSAFARSAKSPDQWQSMVQSVGSYRPYHTHRLLAGSTTARETACADVPKAPTDLVASLTDGLAALGPRTDLHLGARRDFRYSHLEPSQDVSANTPFLMVEVDKCIIKDHNDIFNARVLDFLVEYLALIDLKRGSTAPVVANGSDR